MNRQELARLVVVRQMAQSGSARTVRQRAGVSLGELARVVGVGKTTVFRWERGQRTPRGDAALRYGAALDALSRGAA